MDVFVIPVGSNRYELYCESAEGPDTGGVAETPGWLGRLSRGFDTVLRAAEARERQPRGSASDPAPGWFARGQEWMIAWAVERVAEQRLLWNLRRERAAAVMHPEDLSFDDALAFLLGRLGRERDRHRIWLVVNGVGFIISGPLALIPGPNLVAYYFAFRIVGHWLSIRGADQGMKHVAWSGTPCPPLTELRRATALDPPARLQFVADIAARLRLQHLPTFFERSAVTRA